MKQINKLAIVIFASFCMMLSVTACKNDVNQSSKTNEETGASKISNIESTPADNSKAIVFIDTLNDEFTAGKKISLVSTYQTDKDTVVVTTAAWKFNDMICYQASYTSAMANTNAAYSGAIYTKDKTYLTCGHKIMDGVTGGYEGVNIREAILSYIPTLTYIDTQGDYEHCLYEANGQSYEVYAQVLDDTTMKFADDTTGVSPQSAKIIISDISDEDKAFLNLDNYTKIDAGSMAKETQSFNTNLNQILEQLS